MLTITNQTAGGNQDSNPNVQVKDRGNGEGLHFQVRLSDRVNRPYGASFNVPFDRPVAGILGSAAESTKTGKVTSLATGTGGYTPFHVRRDGDFLAVSTPLVGSKPPYRWMRPFIQDGNFVVRVPADGIPSEVLARL